MLLQSVVLIYLCYALINITIFFGVMLLFTSHSNADLYPVFYLRVYLQCIEVRRSCMDQV